MATSFYLCHFFCISNRNEMKWMFFFAENSGFQQQQNIFDLVDWMVWKRLFFFTLEIFIWIICHFECVLHFFFFFVGSFFWWLMLMMIINMYILISFSLFLTCVWINRHRILDTTQFSSKSLFSGYFFFLSLSIWIQCWSSRVQKISGSISNQ